MICGKCWRRAPKEIRSAWSHWRRRGNALDKRDDPRADLCYRRANGIFNRIRAMLTDPDVESEDMSPLMAEELRKAGLL
jgi:hypothetical protein